MPKPSKLAADNKTAPISAPSVPVVSLVCGSLAVAEAAVTFVAVVFELVDTAAAFAELTLIVATEAIVLPLSVVVTGFSSLSVVAWAAFLSVTTASGSAVAGVTLALASDVEVVSVVGVVTTCAGVVEVVVVAGAVVSSPVVSVPVVAGIAL